MSLTETIANKLKIHHSDADLDLWISVRCPSHNDNNPSATVNFNRKILTCFAGCGSKSFKTLAKELALDYDGEDYISFTSEINESEFFNSILLDSVPIKQLPLKKQIEEYTQFLIERKLNPSVIEEFGGHYESNVTAIDYGHLIIPYAKDKTLKKRIIQGEGHRFILSAGEGKGLLHKGIKLFKSVLLVEGATDLFTLYQNGLTNCVSTLTANVTAQQMYELRGKTVFILFDKDYAGFVGANKAKELLKKLGAVPIILEIPEELEVDEDKTDVNSSYVKYQKDLIDWVIESVNSYSLYDGDYIKKFILNVTNVKYIETGIEGMDYILNGGIPTGFHVFSGQEKIGKSTVIVSLINNFLDKNLRVLLLSYELTKEQMYARIASTKDKHSWSEIEKNHLIICDSAKKYLESIGDKLRIEKNWSMEQIKAASDNFDIIIIDFLQRMPYDGADIRLGVSNNAKELNNLTDKGKVIIAISSKTESSDFKESGDIKYVVQSGWRLYKLTDKIIQAECFLNTRGRLDSVYLDVDFQHQTIKECSAPDIDTLVGKY